MSTSLVVNGVSYLYPDTGDQSWGTVASTWAAAVTSGMLQKAGGNFTLTADANFGANYGLLSKYFSSQSASPSSTGVIRLSNLELVAWRNFGGLNDKSISLNASDVFAITSSVSVTGSITASTQLISSVATGTAPLSVASTTQVANLNAATAGTSTNATNVATTSVSSNASFYPLMVAATANGNQAASLGTGLTFNPSTNTLTTTAFVGALTGNATGLSATLAISSGGTGLTSTSQNFIFSGPTSGSGAPTWRALVFGDIPGISAATASTIMARDASANARINSLIQNYATTATAGATTTLVVGSAFNQFFTGSTTQTVVLPDATTLVLGQEYFIVNLSSGIVTVNKNGGSLVQSMAANSFMTVIVTNIGTAAGSWNPSYSANNAGGGTVTSVTYTGDGVVHSNTPTAAVTTTGTLTASLNTQSANRVLAGPASGSAAAPTFRALGSSDMSAGPNDLLNLGISASVAASALTINLTQSDGSTAPAAGSGAVILGMRNVTAATGGYLARSVTGALSVVVSSGSTLGQVSAVAEYSYVYAIDNAGTIELAVSSQLFDDGSVVSTTAEGGAGAADSRSAIYSTTARTNVPLRLIGRIKSTQATAGTWATSPAEITLNPFQILICGEYTPTFSNNTNVVTWTPYIARYFRIGNYVWVTGMVDIDLNLNGPTASKIYISLPIASNLTLLGDCMGNGASQALGTQFCAAGQIYAEVGPGTRAIYDFLSSTASNQGHCFTFMYVIR